MDGRTDWRRTGAFHKWWTPTNRDECAQVGSRAQGSASRSPLDASSSSSLTCSPSLPSNKPTSQTLAKQKNHLIPALPLCCPLCFLGLSGLEYTHSHAPHDWCLLFFRQSGCRISGQNRASRVKYTACIIPVEQKPPAAPLRPPLLFVLCFGVFRSSSSFTASNAGG